MSEVVHVVVDSVASNKYSDVLSFLSGVIVPLMIILISIYFSRRAEKRSNSYTDAQRAEEVSHRFVERFHDAARYLYIQVNKLQYSNRKRMRIDGVSKGVVENNDKVMGSDSDVAKQMQQENLRYQYNRAEEARDEHAEYLVNVRSAFSYLQAVVNEKHLESLGDAVDVICKSSPEPGAIEESMIESFVSELNKLTAAIEYDPVVAYESMTNMYVRRYKSD